MSLSFDSVDVLIYDPCRQNRTATRATMYALGFRRTETVSSLETFVEAMQKRPPDIALCEAQGAADELCATIQQMRQGGAGHNPFIVIIVTAWEKNTALINKVVSSGADDLLLRALFHRAAGPRIEAHIERRKGFVITTDYVGPDRRKDTGRASNVELFDRPICGRIASPDIRSLAFISANWAVQQFDIGSAAGILAAVGTDIVSGDDKALAALDMGFDPLAQQRGGKGPQQQIVGAAGHHLVDQGGVFSRR